MEQHLTMEMSMNNNSNNNNNYGNVRWVAQLLAFRHHVTFIDCSLFHLPVPFEPKTVIDTIYKIKS